jgi:hypothetical protein
MRLGDCHSKSYRNFHARKHARKIRETQKLCARLDKLVSRAESFGAGTRTRNFFMSGAEKVRAKLREVDH